MPAKASRPKRADDPAKVFEPKKASVGKLPGKSKPSGINAKSLATQEAWRQRDIRKEKMLV